jgi:hypothetical protein
VIVVAHAAGKCIVARGGSAGRLVVIVPRGVPHSTVFALARLILSPTELAELREVFERGNAQQMDDPSMSDF